MLKDMNRHFSMGDLLRFTLPTIAMMIFTSLYTVVDGIFVSNFIGKTALAAVNIIWPVVMVFASVGLMMGAGGSALIAKTRGEGDDARANRYFTMMVITVVAAGVILSALGILFPAAHRSGAGCDGGDGGRLRPLRAHRAGL